jgi:hypothetical protein
VPRELEDEGGRKYLPPIRSDLYRHMVAFYATGHVLGHVPKRMRGFDIGGL